MQSTEAPVSPSTFATETNRSLQRHDWILLAVQVVSHRPEWTINEVINKLWLSRQHQSFPELARIALTVALDPKYAKPASIHRVAGGVARGLIAL